MCDLAAMCISVVSTAELRATDDIVVVALSGVGCPLPFVFDVEVFKTAYIAQLPIAVDRDRVHVDVACLDTSSAPLTGRLLSDRGRVLAASASVTVTVTVNDLTDAEAALVREGAGRAALLQCRRGAL